MYNAQNWERWVNRELMHQLAAKGKIEVPKGEATERYVRSRCLVCLPGTLPGVRSYNVIGVLQYFSLCP